MRPSEAHCSGSLKQPFSSLLYQRAKPSRSQYRHLEQVAAAVDEHKESAAKRVGTHIRANQSAQGVKGLSHVARDPVEIDAGSGAQGQHG